MDARAQIVGWPILTAAAMRDADARAIAAGTPGIELMERAGAAVAGAVAAYVGPAPVLVVCGPGNNGGDGYIVARLLRQAGWPVRVARTAPPASADAIEAASRWDGPTEAIDDAHGAKILIDAAFGTGLARPLGAALADRLGILAATADTVIAIDVPSGVDSDNGELLGCPLFADMTVALAALKPAHSLFPAAARCGRLVLADIGIPCDCTVRTLERPCLGAPQHFDHKYSRGMVGVIAGEMTGAASLSAMGAARGGAGAVLLVGDMPPPMPAIITRRWSDDVLANTKIDAVVIGPGLDVGRAGRRKLDAALGSGKPLVLDAGALRLLADSAIPIGRRLNGVDAILTPHGGEFADLFPDLPGSLVNRAVAAARTAGAIVIFKGADTVIAAPDGRARIATATSFWLATAGSGDILAGVAGAMLAAGLPAFEAASAAVWLHGAAARHAGPWLVASDLVHHLPAALTEALVSTSGHIVR